MEARVNENLLQTNDGGGFLLLLFMHRKSGLERHLATNRAGKETKMGGGRGNGITSRLQILFFISWFY